MNSKLFWFIVGIVCGEGLPVLWHAIYLTVIWLLAVALLAR